MTISEKKFSNQKSLCKCSLPISLTQRPNFLGLGDELAFTNKICPKQSHSLNRLTEKRGSASLYVPTQLVLHAVLVSWTIFGQTVVVYSVKYKCRLLLKLTGGSKSKRGYFVWSIQNSLA